MDYLRKCEFERAEKLLKEGVRVGDMVGLINQYRDVWHEVDKTFFESKETEPLSAMLKFYNNEGVSRLEFLSRVIRVHHRGDPWNFGEAKIIYTKQGHFSDWLHYHGEKPLPIPDEFRYQGTFTIEPWLWYYGGRNCNPKNPIPLKELADKAKLPIEGVPWKEAYSVIERLKETKIKGWSVTCKLKAEQKFEKTFIAV
jgi:hypothetical protein